MTPTAERLAQEWGFIPKEELPGGYCSHVYANETLVLKVPFRGEEMTTGRLAAERMSGGAGVTVFQSDRETGAVLMERLGAPLWASGKSNDEEIDIFLSLAWQLALLPTEGLMELRDYVSNSDSLASKLIATAEDSVFLHGDLHHENMCLSSSGWKIIDPKGLVGDRAYEAAAFMLNPIGRFLQMESVTEYQRHRILRLSQGLGVDPKRVWGWATVLLRDGDDRESEEGRILGEALAGLAQEFEAGLG